MSKFQSLKAFPLREFIEQQKRRRFHPLRNLRRIFRRRTITNPSETSLVPISSLSTQLQAPLPPQPSRPTRPVNSNSEKNLRSATLSFISSLALGSSSSPTSPQSSSYASLSLPKSKSTFSEVPALKFRAEVPHITETYMREHKFEQQAQKLDEIYRDDKYRQRAELLSTDGKMFSSTATAKPYVHNHHQLHEYYRQQQLHAQHQQYQQHHRVPPTGENVRPNYGVPVLPVGHLNRNFYFERPKMHSVGDESFVELADSDASTSDGVKNEMSDSQRSLNEGRLVDSEHTRDTLSQSHDSVFSDLTTANSLVSVLKAELADVLRKRRNRPDASDEDLGLPRSPASPQRRVELRSNKGAPEVSSLTMLSMSDECLASSTPNNSASTPEGRTTSSSRYTTRSSASTSLSSDVQLRHCVGSSSIDDTKDEVDLFNSDVQRLSHDAAKHKMALRPPKKKVPTRQNRRTLETSIPEDTEDAKMTVIDTKADIKVRTRSLPPGVNAKILDCQTDYDKASGSYMASTKVPIAAVSKEPAEKYIKNDKLIAVVPNIKTTMPTSPTKTVALVTITNTKATGSMESKIVSSNENATRPKKNEDHAETPQHEESGFLRRLMTRNSKRSIAKATNGDDEELDLHSIKPKKLQVSTSNVDLTDTPALTQTLQTVRSEISHEQNVEATRKDIQRVIRSEGSFGLSAMVNSYGINKSTDNFTASRVSEKETQLQKPKSGPAARQRYLPQEIVSVSNTNDRSRVDVQESSTQSMDTFQSTSLVREISASHKTEHQHFEKKPKIVGLSTFQQKISRSNDSVAARSGSPGKNTSTSSLEGTTAVTYLGFDELKQQRRAVEKSRSFRTYNNNNVEERDPANVHNNMPSLPDLSVSLPVPYYSEFILNDREYSSPSPPDPYDKSVSLGFEINDNNLVKPTTLRAESISNLPPNPCLKKIVSSNSKTTPNKLLTPGHVVPSLSPSNSCNQNISEIEQNIDLIVKSPYVSVLRKSGLVSEETPLKKCRPVYENVMPERATKKPEVDQSHEPKVHPITLDQSTNVQTMPACTAAAVPLREKRKLESKELRSPTTSTAPKEIVRKSAPVAVTSTTDKSNSFKSTRRSSSVLEHAGEHTNSNEIVVPEFMKIQLNRVDPACIAKSNIVLAKNIKETAAPPPQRSFSTDDLLLRRCSNESMEITEQEATQTTAAVESTAQAVVKIASTTPTPTEDENVEVLLRRKINELPTSTNTCNGSKFSLQEIKRRFMSDDKTNTEELKTERKKSINEEFYRKSTTLKCEEKVETKPEPHENAVILRKKSFGGLPQNGSYLNGLGAMNLHKDDSTPELMKVFARRSLKVKDEDLISLTNGNSNVNGNGNVNGSITPTSVAKKSAPPAQTQQNVDSDKENQSSSDEKLDKMSTSKVKMETIETTSSGTRTSCGTRLVDFRNGSIIKNAGTCGNGFTVNKKTNNNNIATNSNNNNNNNNNNRSPTTTANNKNQLPPKRGMATTAQQNGSLIKSSDTLKKKNANNNNNIINNNNNNNSNSINNNNNNKTIKQQTPEQQLPQRKSLDAAVDSAEERIKPKERPVTTGEFKGIHQRRAEWEQRAKEAFK